MEYKQFRSGEPVTAQFMTELTNTVVDAERNSKQAKTNSEQADENAKIAKANSEQVLAKVNGAYDKATEVKEKADRGEFNGKNIYIKYNSSPSDTGASETWLEGMNYIGFVLSKDLDAPETGYHWVRFVGAQGVQGAVGVGISKTELVGNRIEGDKIINIVQIYYTNGKVDVLEIPMQSGNDSATITSITVTRVD